MEFSFSGAYPEQRIELTFDAANFQDPGYVLVYAFYKGKLLFTHHKKRGWELPGGCRNQDEWPIDTAIREVFEETGAVLKTVKPIGQYIIHSPRNKPQVKTIYYAQVKQFHPIPQGFETDDRQLLPPPSPDSIISEPSFSLILKDEMYKYSLPVVLSVLSKKKN